MKVAVVIDMQNDFMPGGALPVPRGREIVPNILEALKDFDHVIFTQDFHPENHISFASSHENKRPFDQIKICGQTLTLWPDHCIAGSVGAEIVPEFSNWGNDKSVSYALKGLEWHNEGFSPGTALSSVLSWYAEEGRVPFEVTVMGVATEYCVRATVLDLLRHPCLQNIYVKESCIAPVDELSGILVQIDMEAAGAILIP